MIIAKSSLLLRRVLAADAAISAACGLLMAIGAELSAPLFGLPASAFGPMPAWRCCPGPRWSAISLTRVRLPYAVVWTVIACKTLSWAADCVPLLASGAVAPTLLLCFVHRPGRDRPGLAEIQYFGLRRSMPVTAGGPKNIFVMRGLDPRIGRPRQTAGQAR